MDISIIIPVYNEQDNVSLLHSELKKVLNSIKKSYEMIFVDDGSNDNTLKRLEELNRKDKRIRVVSFARNFGKASALMAGFKESKGSIIFTMDGDLQDDPKEIPNFIKKIGEGYDLVNGWKFVRHDPLGKTMPSKFFNFLTRKITGVNVHDSNCGFKAYKRQVIQNIKIHGELHRYIPSIVRWKGFRVGEIKVEHHPRRYGKSKYGVERLMKGFLDLITVRFITKYTRRPLHFFGPIGILSILLGFIAGAYLTWQWFTIGGIGNRPMLFLSVLLIVVGVQFISLGLLGEMIANMNPKEDYVIKKKL
ncbi:glycosyltransferase [Candidatus Woesearchaeota archaeon CG10_big_fil_rev_8_21_14_0_10_44_13]|nr:MAG: glycosyltransferase [Candidatus Woesearchaeota archaeon CG10_big_fil_rev_8_21_14_0_10_44_13]